MKNRNIPVRNIAAISGHASLDQLARYLEVTEDDKEAAIAVLSF